MPEAEMPLGFRSPWGRVIGWKLVAGKRWYFCVTDDETTSVLSDGLALMPADFVEDAWEAFLEVQRDSFEKAHV